MLQKISREAASGCVEGTANGLGWMAAVSRHVAACAWAAAARPTPKQSSQPPGADSNAYFRLPSSEHSCMPYKPRPAVDAAAHAHAACRRAAAQQRLGWFAVLVQGRCLPSRVHPRSSHGMDGRFIRELYPFEHRRRANLFSLTSCTLTQPCVCTYHTEVGWATAAAWV